MKTAANLEASPYISEEQVAEYCRKIFDCEIDLSELQLMINIGLLPVYKCNNINMILKNDLASMVDMFKVQEANEASVPLCEGLFNQDVIRIGHHTSIDLTHEDHSSVPSFYSAVRNLISAHNELVGTYDVKPSSISYFAGGMITTKSEKVIQYAQRQLHREKQVDMSSISQFARSAYYMGSKRALCSFIVEALSSVIPESGIVVDLMCGSGVASGAFSRIWRTISSDAQEFCRILALIHGGGFSRAKAQDLLYRITPIFKTHFDELKRRFNNDIDIEDELFCRNTDELLLNDYREFIKNFPTIASGTGSAKWNPREEVDYRKNDPAIYPYCLFTAYFSNVYFGLRQSIEIDSLRYSIDQLHDENERRWALGALIASVSALGTTYGGHFAQPAIRNYDALTIKKISNIIDVRSPSILHEFSVRLLNLSEQSQYCEREIEILPGPWKHTLSILDDKLICKPILVYVDAPYTREEYSRYYHVLETLIKYNYPSCGGIGLTPKPEDRFRTEFFSKNKTQIKDSLANVIIEIIRRGWLCAWSYSDSGTANIYEVISVVYDKIKCDIKSYATPFVHKSQGGAKPKKVTEYLVIFIPKK